MCCSHLNYLNNAQKRFLMLTLPFYRMARIISNTKLRFIRYLGLVLNAVTMISSIGLIGFTLRTLVEMSSVAYVIGTHLLNYATALICLVGICTFIVAPLGFYSIIISHNTMIVTYMICIFFVSLLSAAGGWLGYHFNREIRSGDVQLWMKSGLKFEYGNPSVPYFKDAWDNLQRRYKCCGVSTEHSASEWLTSQWFKDLKIWPRPRVPESCCTTCETIYQMFCKSQLTKLHMSEELTEQELICLEVSSLCDETDDTLADEDACVGKKAELSKGIPRDAVMHTKGCYDPLFIDLNLYGNRIMLCGFFMFCLALVSCLTFFILHDQIFNSCRYKAILYNDVK